MSNPFLMSGGSLQLEMICLVSITKSIKAHSLHSVCHLWETEDLLCFLAVCPVYHEIRRRWFESSVLSGSDVSYYLNRRDWDALNNFSKMAFNRRMEIINKVFFYKRGHIF